MLTKFRKKTRNEESGKKPKSSGFVSTSGWRYFDLKNRKQSGDLEKKIYQLKSNENAKVFNFVCSRPKEGVTTIFANFLQYIREQNNLNKILIVDANFLAPCLHRVFNQKNATGLADLLEGSTDLNSAVTDLGILNLSFLACGQDYKNMAGNISLEKFNQIIEEAKQTYDSILIDSPPLLISSDSISTAIASDYTFLVIQALKVQREVAMRAKSLLSDSACPIGGVILNRVPQVIPSWVYRIL